MHAKSHFGDFPLLSRFEFPLKVSRLQKIVLESNQPSQERNGLFILLLGCRASFQTLPTSCLHFTQLSNFRTIRILSEPTGIKNWIVRKASARVERTKIRVFLILRINMTV